MKSFCVVNQSAAWSPQFALLQTICSEIVVRAEPWRGLGLMD